MMVAWPSLQNDTKLFLLDTWEECIFLSYFVSWKHFFYFCKWCYLHWILQIIYKIWIQTRQNKVWRKTLSPNTAKEYLLLAGLPLVWSTFSHLHTTHVALPWKHSSNCHPINMAASGHIRCLKLIIARAKCAFGSRRKRRGITSGPNHNAISATFGCWGRERSAPIKAMP